MAKCKALTGSSVKGLKSIEEAWTASNGLKKVLTASEILITHAIINALPTQKYKI